MIQRIPPHALDAERAILGCILYEGRSALDRVMVSPLVATDFYTESHRAIYGAIASLASAEKPVDILTVSEELTRTGNLSSAGGPAALALILQEAAILVHLDAYLDIVVGKGKLRSVIQESSKAITEAFDAEKSAEEIIGGTLTVLERLGRRQRTAKYDPAVNWEHIVSSWKVGTVALGLREIDEITGGITPGQTIVVAGRTSQGKTAFAWDRALALAKSGKRIDFISLEENIDAATRRAVANLADVAVVRLRSGDLNQVEFQRAEDAVRELQDLPITVHGVESLGATDENAIIGTVSLSRAEVVMIDHLQKIEPRMQGKHDLRTYAIGRVMDRLEKIGLRDSKVIWVNVQLSREEKVRGKKKATVVPPVLADIRDSAAIENTARHVFLLNWPWKQKSDEDPTEYQVFVAKNSEGGTGVATLSFRASVGRFANRGGG